MTRSLAICLLLLLFPGQPVHAAEFCVSTSAGLQSALTTAETNGQDDTIRIAVGSYETPGGSFVYDAVTPANGDDKSLAIVGGWHWSFGACVPLPNERLSPWQTILDGHGIGRVLRITTRTNGNVTVRLLTFANGNAYQSAGDNDSGGGLLVRVDGDYEAGIRVERNAFINNIAQFGGGLSAFNEAGSFGHMHVTNNVFWENFATTNGAAELGLNDGRIYLISNTALDNRASLEGVGGIYLGPTDIFIANNNLWGNDGLDLYFRGPQQIPGTALFNNNIEDLGSVPEFESDNISVEPQYEPGVLNFTPVLGSPLVDAGIQPPPVGLWSLSETDLIGRPRVMGGSVDIGAYENERIFTDGFDPAGPF